MAQFLNPTADLHVGAWTTNTAGTTDLWEMLADPVPDEANYIQSELSPVTSVYVVALGSVTDPGSSTGHTVAWMQRNPETDATVDLTVQLRQGYVSEVSQGTLIATWTESDIPSAFTIVTKTLTAGEADAISNYGALSLRFVATEA